MIVRGAFTRLLQPGLKNAMAFSGRGAEFDNDSVLSGRCRPPDPNDYVLRSIGNVKIIRVYRGKRQPLVYHVTMDDLLIGHGLSVRSAIDNARLKIPRKPRKITGEIIAVRGWCLVGDLLMPLTRGDDYESWSGPVASVPRDVLNESHGGGLYCVKPNTDLIRQLLRDYHNYAVYGMVALSGRVIEYERGYRAQRAAVRALIVVPPVGDLVIKALEQRYQCDVRRER